MEKEQLEIIKQKMDLVADVSISHLQSALNYYNSLKKNQHIYIEKYRKKPENREKLNEYAKIKMRELRAKRKAEKQAQQI
jgi:hypothetical protein